MRNNFAKLKNLGKSNIIKRLVSKNEGAVIQTSLFKFAYNFFEAVDKMKLNGIQDDLLHSEISLETFINRCVTKETIKRILKQKSFLNALQIQYFEELDNLKTDYFEDLYSGPLKAAYTEHGYLYKPTLTKKERQQVEE